MPDHYIMLSTIHSQRSKSFGQQICWQRDEVAYSMFYTACFDTVYRKDVQLIKVAPAVARGRTMSIIE